MYVYNVIQRYLNRNHLGRGKTAKALLSFRLRFIENSASESLLNSSRYIALPVEDTNNEGAWPAGNY